MQEGISMRAKCDVCGLMANGTVWVDAFGCTQAAMCYHCQALLDQDLVLLRDEDPATLRAIVEA